jgi:hypothetical protein
MRRFAVSIAVTALVGAGMTLGTAAPAFAVNHCTGAIVNTTVAGNLIVPKGATCTLGFVTVTGSVIALPGSSLTIDPAVHIQGDLTGSKLAASACGPTIRQPLVVRGDVSFSGGHFIVCPGTQIDGNLTITRDVVTPFVLNPTGVSIGGNFTFTKSADKAGNISGWAIGGSATITRNGGGTLDFSNSTVGKLVMCTRNAPTITGTEVEANNLGGPNGNGLYGQCAGLDPV